MSVQGKEEQGLHIVQAFACEQDSPRQAFYSTAIRHTLTHLLSEGLLELLQDPLIEKTSKQSAFEKQLPKVHHHVSGSGPFHVSFFVLSLYRSSSFKFFLEIINSWLIPGKRLNIVLIYASNFYLPQVSTETYTLCEIAVRIDDPKDLEAIKHALPLLESEICLGTASAYYARRILEVRGMAMDEKAAQIHEQMVHLVKRFPALFTSDLYNEMQHLMVTCCDGFKEQRTVSHLSRLIAAYSYFRSTLHKAAAMASHRRHLFIKVLPGILMNPASGSTPRRVLGVLIAVHFANEAEGIEKQHVYRTLQQYLPGALLVAGSILTNYRAAERSSLLYLEVERADGSLWPLSQLNVLRARFTKDLQHHIQQPIHPVFNPRNEEEMMRNLLALAQQVEHPQDLPQLFLSFEEQSYTHLFFIVLIVRVHQEGNRSIQEQFNASDSFLDYLHEQNRTLGRIRKKYVKDATIFRVRLEKQSFVRHDQSIDLIAVRQQVFVELQRILGELRDYNGGMISKQSQILDDLRALLEEERGVNPFFLNRFFYSLTPTVTRHAFPLPVLVHLYCLMMQCAEQNRPVTANAGTHVFSTIDDTLPAFLYVVLIIEEPTLNAKLHAHLQTTLTRLKVPPTSLASTSFRLSEAICFGCVYRGENPMIREALLKALRPFAGAKK